MRFERRYGLPEQLLPPEACAAVPEELHGEESHDAVEHGSRGYGRARSHVRLEEHRRED